MASRIKAVGEWMRQGWQERGIDFALDVVGVVGVIVGFIASVWILAR